MRTIEMENTQSSFLAFTVCANNYLSQAYTLGHSFKKLYPDIKFVIVLVDKKNENINYETQGFEIIEVEEIEEEIEQLATKYNIIELICCMKARGFQFFFNKYDDINKIFYLDADLYLYNKFLDLEDELDKNDILITPHILKPITIDDKKPSENNFLKFGIYNLGFIGIKRSENSFQFLDWWKTNTYLRGHIDIMNGQFVDQLPINLAPILFNNVKVLKNPGLNVAPWNFHERELSCNNESYFVNNTVPLIFLHFSNFLPTVPIKITTTDWYQRVTLEDNTDLKKLYTEYSKKLYANSYIDYSTLIPYYNRFFIKKEIKFSRQVIIKLKSAFGI